MKFHFDDPIGLAQCLREFIANPEYFKVSLRKNVQWLADILHYNMKWVAMSPEELILRRHYDFSGYEVPDARRPVDTFHHVHLFRQLGICNDEKEGYRVVNAAIGKLISIGMLKKGSSSDVQAEYPNTRLAEPERAIEETMYELRRRLDENRT